MEKLDREEFVEQAYFWRTFRERLQDGDPSQEILDGIREELLSTSNLPMAIEFLLGEMKQNGRLSDGLVLMPHYFSAFQAFVMTQADDERIRFDIFIALRILEHEAEYLASDHATPSGLFIYQFECIARNRLGYDFGMRAISDDPMFDNDWRDWVLWVNKQLGAAEFCEFLYLRSQYAVEEKRRAIQDHNWQPDVAILFGAREGRIAKANKGKDPLYMFAALQRQLGYPKVPRPERRNDSSKVFHPMLEQRLQQLEKRLKLIEQEAKGGIDLSEFYAKPEASDEDADENPAQP
jgi:hypothetical protein